MDSSTSNDNLEKLLDRIDAAASEHERVLVGSIMEHVGRRSFGPLLLLAGLIVVAPVIGDIPGVPTLVAVLLALIAIQLLLQRKYFWLPKALLKRSLAQGKLRKSVGAMRKPARFIDKLLKPRLVYLTEGAAIRVIAVVALCIALAMPPMEIIPFSANLAGGAITAFDLSLISKDGLVALIAYCFTAGIAVLVISNFI